LNRRIFIRDSALALAGIGTAPLWLKRAMAASPAQGRRKILVAVFQRGAADGLNIVVPHGEAAYYRLRPTIAVPRPGSGEGSAIDLNGFFGLHPSLASLKPIYDQGHLAIVDAVGSPDPTRSHFDAQDYMESGTPGSRAAGSGWMNRALGERGSKEDVSSLPGVALGPVLPKSLEGPNAAVAVQNLAEFQVRDPAASAEFERLYSQSQDPLLSAAAKRTFGAVATVRALQKQPYIPERGVQYPPGRFGDGLRLIAQLIKADVGLEMAFADIGGWDHHVNEMGQRATEGQLANLLRQYGDSLAAFWRDMGDRMEDIALVTMSEFGRTAQENGSRGTDHGHANCMFVMGGSVAGGKVFGRWPGLEKEQLNEGRDLALTTDFRDVLSELLALHMGGSGLDAVFPGFRPSFQGIVNKS
jgi:uncharacterized protein (DUF1501 family)